MVADSDPLRGFLEEMKPHKARYEADKAQATPRPRRYLTRGPDDAPIYTTDANGTEVRNYEPETHLCPKHITGQCPVCEAHDA